MIYIYRFLVFVLIFLVGYLFGSIPSGVIIGKLFYKKDPRDYGSHNPGGTNTGRILGKKAGAITILLDIIKTIIPIILTFCLFTYIPALNEFMDESDTVNTLNVFGQGNTLVQLTYYLAAFGVMIGHGFSIFLHFKGGKIVSTYGGTELCLSYLTIPLFAGLFGLILKLKKKVSLSSLIVGASIAVFSWAVYIIYACTYLGGNYAEYFMWFGYGPTCCIYYPILMTVGYIILFFKHHSNIERLKHGEEAEITWMK